MKKLFSFFLAFSLVFSAVSFRVNAVSTYDVKVGKTISIYRSSSVSNVYDVVWSADSTAVTIETEAFSYCKVRGDRAEKNVLITADIYYYIYSGSYSYGAHTQEAFRVNVIANDPTSISLKSSISINAGSSYTLTPTLSPSGATSTITWSSSNSSVATVSSGGVVRGVGGGSATITARTANGLSDTCYVTVSIPPLTLSSVSPASGSTEIAKNSVVKFYYNASLEKGSSFSAISLKDMTTNRIVSSTTAISSSTLTITPASLSPGHKYTATIPAGAVQSIYGAVGSAQTTTFTVKAVDVVNITPANGAVNVPRNQAVVVECKESLVKGSKWSAIKFIKTSNSSAVAYNAVISGNKVTITPKSNLDYLAEYKVTIPAGAIANNEGINGGEEFIVSFTVKPGPLQIKSSFPTSGSSNVDVDSELKIIYNYPMVEGTNFESILLKNQDTQVEEKIEKEISDKTLVIKPVKPLEYNSNYVLSIPASALSNGVDGGNSATKISFKTISEEKEVVAAPKINEDRGMVSITAEKGEVIYYTVDGSNPVLSGIKYTGLFSVPLDNTLVRAVAVKNGTTSIESSKTVSADLVLSKKSDTNSKFADMASTADGYVAVCNISSSEFGTGIWSGVTSKGYTDAAIVKYDLNDNIVWKKVFGGSYYECFYGVTALDDGYVAVGYVDEESLGTGDWSGFSNLGNSAPYACAVKFDLNGNLVWKKLYQGSAYNDESDYFYDVTATEDGGVIAVGFSSSSRFANRIGDALIVKYDKDGFREWSKIFGGNDSDYFNDVTFVNGGYVAVGYAEPKHDLSGDYDLSGLRKGSNDAIIVKYDTSGNVVWKKVFGGSGWDNFNTVTATNDGGVIAVGYSAKGSFENGDWSGVIGYGWDDCVAVKYNSQGGIVWKKQFGGNNVDYFHDVVTVDDGYIILGWSSADSMGTYDWTGVSGEGGSFVIKYDLNGNLVFKQLYEHSYFTGMELLGNGFVLTGNSDTSTNARINKSSVYSYTDKTGKIAVIGEETVVKGNEFALPLYFTPKVSVMGMNVTLNYPACISYVDFKSNYKNLYISESVAGNTKTLTVSANFIQDESLPAANITSTLANLRFKLDENCTEKQCVIAINTGETFFMGDDGNGKTSFVNASNYKFTVSSAKAKELFILGKSTVTGPYRYKCAVFPKSAETKSISWAVTNETVATISNKGFLTPLKNGEITITATDSVSGVNSSFTLSASGIGSYVNSIISNVGAFDRVYAPSELERVLYVPKGTKSVNLTANYTSGSLSSSTATFGNNVATSVAITALPQKVELIKTDTGMVDSKYVITIKEDARDIVVKSVTAANNKVVVNAGISSPADGIMYTALYNSGKLIALTKQQVTKSQNSVTATVNGMGDQVKIMVFDNKNQLNPRCDATIVAIK